MKTILSKCLLWGVLMEVRVTAVFQFAYAWLKHSYQPPAYEFGAYLQIQPGKQSLSSSTL